MSKPAVSGEPEVNSMERNSCCETNHLTVGGGSYRVDKTLVLTFPQIIATCTVNASSVGTV